MRLCRHPKMKNDLCTFPQRNERITRQTTTLAHYDLAMLKLGSKISCARSTVLLTGNLSFHSSQNGGVVCRNVIRHGRQLQDGSVSLQPFFLGENENSRFGLSQPPKDQVKNQIHLCAFQGCGVPTVGISFQGKVKSHQEPNYESERVRSSSL